MTDQTKSIGKTTIAPEVLVTIIKLTTLDEAGVLRLAPTPGKVDAFFKKGVEEGIRINVENGVVYVDLHIIVENGHNVKDVSRSLQKHVARAISEMIGMEPGKVNIHIEDIDYKNSDETNKV